MFYECYKHYSFHIILNKTILRRCFGLNLIQNSKNITQNSYLKFITHVSKLRLIENPKLRTHLWFITQNHVSNSQYSTFINILWNPPPALFRTVTAPSRVWHYLSQNKIVLSSSTHTESSPSNSSIYTLPSPSPQNPFPGNPKVWNCFDASLRSFSVVGALLCFE